jgi:hypothetical protein
MARRVLGSGPGGPALAQPGGLPQPQPQPQPIGHLDRMHPIRLWSTCRATGRSYPRNASLRDSVQSMPPEPVPVPGMMEARHRCTLGWDQAFLRLAWPWAMVREWAVRHQRSSLKESSRFSNAQRTHARTSSIGGFPLAKNLHHISARSPLKAPAARPCKERNFKEPRQSIRASVVRFPYY